MSKQVVLICHNDAPTDDRVSTWLHLNGFQIDRKKPFAGDMLGEPDPLLHVGTVIYGGKYDVYETEKYPFLNEEYRWIDACIRHNIPMLGICQGAQMIAYHLGAWVGEPDSKLCEFGFYRVEPVEGGKDFMAEPYFFAQSHYHTFDIPEGAVLLASNDTFPHQAFSYGDRTYGIQFHPEQTIEGFRRWQNADWAYWGKRGAQTRDEQTKLMMEHDQAQADWFYGFLEKLFG